ncbi:MAG: methylated-DNA--[protein]-cysteine S-methyltransferase [Gammaproteobacteria bacterium]|nr:methylated-DNA--[protein]-cysteine S-methyltransferase [Gammaproteobacteria bacterium]
MQPVQMPQPEEDDYARIASAIAFLAQHRRRQPELQAVADHLGLSASRTQRLFSRWAGVSPKRFMQLLTVEHAKQRMAETGDLLSLSLDAGLSGPGRLHDLFVNLEAMSPGEYRRAADGITIRYGVGGTPFGSAVVAHTARGICHLAFLAGQADGDLRGELQCRWPSATLQRDDASAAGLLRRVFAPSPDAIRGLSLWVSGTNFQVQVWRALLRVPSAGLLSYGQFARLVGNPRAARAVGTAMANNPVAYLIPCHRVLRESGDFGVYHWGGERKIAICAWEAAERIRVQGREDEMA